MAAATLYGFSIVPLPAGSTVSLGVFPPPPGISYGSGTSSQLGNVNAAIVMASIDNNIFFIIVFYFICLFFRINDFFHVRAFA